MAVTTVTVSVAITAHNYCTTLALTPPQVYYTLIQAYAHLICVTAL